MLTMMMFLVLQELFVGVGAGGGTSFTDTRVHPHVMAQATFYPSTNVGMFYRFSWSNPVFSIKQPFSFKKDEQLHIAGGAIRFSKGKVQPFLEPGIAWYKESVNIKLFGNDILNENQERIAGAVSGGVSMHWKNLYFIPAVRVVGGKRPLWQSDISFSWRFGNSQKGR